MWSFLLQFSCHYLHVVFPKHRLIPASALDPCLFKHDGSHACTHTSFVFHRPSCDSIDHFLFSQILPHLHLRLPGAILRYIVFSRASTVLAHRLACFAKGIDCLAQKILLRLRMSYMSLQIFSCSHISNELIYMRRCLD